MKILIIGGYGTALNIAEAIQHAIDHYQYKAEIMGFLNDELVGGKIGRFNVVNAIANVSSYYDSEHIKIIYALYRPDKMRERTDLLRQLNIPERALFNFIHPLSYCSDSVQMGLGNIVLQHCAIQNQVVIGNHNIINSHVVVEHDTVIEHHNFLAAGAVLGSHVQVGSQCFLGLNATVRENITMAQGSFLGMGSVLLNNTNPDEIWYGVPATKR